MTNREKLQRLETAMAEPPATFAKRLGVSATEIERYKRGAPMPQLVVSAVEQLAARIAFARQRSGEASESR